MNGASDNQPMAAESTEDRMAGLDHAEVRYFTSYSYDHHGIHEEMLVKFRMSHERFAVRAGAKHVIGVDMSSIIQKARNIVAANGMTRYITLLQGKMEEVQMPLEHMNDGKVDIIISEWMGYFLLYESMLDTVLYARDKYLAPGGKIFPDKATILMAAIEDGEYKDDKIGFWDNVYGFDFSPMKDSALSEPLVDTVELKALVTDPCPVFTIDLNTIKSAELSFTVPYSLKVQRNDFIHALIAWFDIEFTACHKPIRFSTGPHAKYTHWKQTVFYLREVVTVDEGESLTGHLTNAPNQKNKRDLDIKISYELLTEDPSRYAAGENGYRILAEEDEVMTRILIFRFLLLDMTI
ncbi:MAG: hypothetical protein Q9227_006897 [Pyrenula ochraceoflavens]